MFYRYKTWFSYYEFNLNFSSADDTILLYLKASNINYFLVKFIFIEGI